MKDIVEDFKQWRGGRDKRKVMLHYITSLVWMLAVIIYLVLGFFFSAWHPGWLVFALAPIVTHIVKMLCMLREDN